MTTVIRSRTVRRITVRRRSIRGARAAIRRSRVAPEPVEVMVVGDGSFITAISERLRGRSRISVTGGAITPRQAVERARLLRPDVVVIDIDHGFELGGLETADAIRRAAPSAGFVMVSPYRDDKHLAAFPDRSLPWSYILAETAADPSHLAMAVAHASWALRYVDPAVDRRRLGDCDRDLDLAVRRALAGVNAAKPEVPGCQVTHWHGIVQTFRLPERDTEDSPDEGGQSASPSSEKNTARGPGGMFSRLSALLRGNSSDATAPAL
jgi:CheY-like chemotaxis protein